MQLIDLVRRWLGKRREDVHPGILTDATGLAASGNKTSPQGVQAGAVYASKQGYTIKYVVADTMTSPSGALSEAQQLLRDGCGISTRAMT